MSHISGGAGWWGNLAMFASCERAASEREALPSKVQPTARKRNDLKRRLKGRERVQRGEGCMS